MAHTPGEWFADLSEMTGHLGFDIKDQNGRLVATAYARQTVSSDDRRSWTAAGQSEAVANARLIAAAPDLLEAVEDLVELAEWTMDWANNDGGEFEPDARLAPARAALRKAKGK